VSGVNNVATAGPVIGDYLGVRDSVRNPEQSMFTSGAKSDAALAEALKHSNAVIGAYNARIGG
jgi:hypothetical protein